MAHLAFFNFHKERQYKVLKIPLICPRKSLYLTLILLLILYRNILSQAEQHSNLLESLAKHKENQWRVRQVNTKGETVNSSF